jgi:hypothetical protein
VRWTDTHYEANSHLQFCKCPKNHKKSLEFRHISPQTQQNPEHMHLKFLIPLTPSIDKIVNLHGFMQIYKPRKINLLFSHVDQNGISPKMTQKGFKKCCISNAVDRIDEDLLWNGNE